MKVVLTLICWRSLVEGLVRVRLIQRDKNPRGREEEEEAKEE